jgi:SAM-dependent MidA family methyltransferase
MEWAKEAGVNLNRGFVVTIDYGFSAPELFMAERAEGTLLCHYRHTLNDDPFSRVGSQDITAHVDFTSVVRAGSQTGLALTGFTNQLSFLMGLGIGEELMEVTDDSAQSLKAITHNQSIKELIMPGGAGENFKVLVQHKGIKAPVLSGFSFRDKKELLQ